jgi:hypothetical protein
MVNSLLLIKRSSSYQGMEHTYQPRIARRLPQSQVANHLTVSGKYIRFIARGGVEVPDPRLLHPHAACAKILDMSGAADYVDRLHFDAEELRQEHTVREDGSSNLYALLCARSLGIEVQ